MHQRPAGVPEDRQCAEARRGEVHLAMLGTAGHLQDDRGQEQQHGRRGVGFLNVLAQPLRARQRLGLVGSITREKRRSQVRRIQTIHEVLGRGTALDGAVGDDYHLRDRRGHDILDALHRPQDLVDQLHLRIAADVAHIQSSLDHLVRHASTRLALLSTGMPATSSTHPTNGRLDRNNLRDLCRGRGRVMSAAVSVAAFVTMSGSAGIFLLTKTFITTLVTLDIRTCVPVRMTVPMAVTMPAGRVFRVTTRSMAATFLATIVVLTVRVAQVAVAQSVPMRMTVPMTVTVRAGGIYRRVARPMATTLLTAIVLLIGASCMVVPLGMTETLSMALHVPHLLARATVLLITTFVVWLLVAVRLAAAAVSVAAMVASMAVAVAVAVAARASMGRG
mmetsp:Transcript_52951/g.172332  ORF Transcript_52951/g.172332 Transcript_52951/m.172332 type:complete len:391 (-) Transcript_52951:55-1227(-)